MDSLFVNFISPSDKLENKDRERKIEKKILIYESECLIDFTLCNSENIILASIKCQVWSSVK